MPLVCTPRGLCIDWLRFNKRLSNTCTLTKRKICLKYFLCSCERLDEIRTRKTSALHSLQFCKFCVVANFKISGYLVRQQSRWGPKTFNASRKSHILTSILVWRHYQVIFLWERSISQLLSTSFGLNLIIETLTTCGFTRKHSIFCIRNLGTWFSHVKVMWT